jgi:hypothetical protein
VSALRPMVVAQRLVRADAAAAVIDACARQLLAVLG